jgi:hypothetical protein
VDHQGEQVEEAGVGLVIQHLDQVTILVSDHSWAAPIKSEETEAAHHQTADVITILICNNWKSSDFCLYEKGLRNIFANISTNLDLFQVLNGDDLSSLLGQHLLGLQAGFIVIE